MAKVDLIMPKMGESIMEATILKWLKKEGDPVQEDETILEIATDKVDSEIPSPISGTLGTILFNENDVIEVGTVIAHIYTEIPIGSSYDLDPEEIPIESNPIEVDKVQTIESSVGLTNSDVNKLPSARPSQSLRFYSPLVRNIASKEGIQIDELDQVKGSGMNGRVTKKDLLGYISHRPSSPNDIPSTINEVAKQVNNPAALEKKTTIEASEIKIPSTSSSEGNVEIIQMDRMRKLIANHMVNSKHTAAHVTSFVEADVTNMVTWRNGIKDQFAKKHKQKITFTPLFIAAVIRAIKDFPGINASVDGDNIIIKHDINIGMAAALPSGNLIVPVIKNADHYNLIGLTQQVNSLADKARNNKLSPDDIRSGTFTLTNVGTFGNVMGTPIINQPQVAILATGAIRKKPAVMETEFGDVIAIRQMMFLSLSYDHRIVDGFLGGSFLRKVADYLESFDMETEI